MRAASTLDRALSVQTENTMILSTDPNDATGKAQESVCPVEDLELLVAGAKYLLVASAKELCAFGGLGGERGPYLDG